VRPEAADLSAAVQAIVERSEPALTRAGAVVELDAPPGVRARFDPDALARIVGNLLDNAEKYSREHADRTISVREESRLLAELLTGWALRSTIDASVAYSARFDPSLTRSAALAAPKINRSTLASSVA
jgi:signal transduction histidine kinase